MKKEKECKIETEEEALHEQEPEITDEAAGDAAEQETGDAAALKDQLADKSKQCVEYLDRLQRTAAEFDNYKKRTAREKETLYSEAVADSVCAFLPVLDSLERALKTAVGEESGQAIREGIELVHRQFMDVLKKLGVEEIKSVGETFDPQRHNAVMHVEDEGCGCSAVIEEFQKGYMLRDRVIRHCMVKVAN